MSDYVGVVTAIGQQKIAAAIGGAALNLTTIRVGDGNGAEIRPNQAMTDLVRRVGGAYMIISSGRDTVNPNHWRVAAIIPAADGPFDIREIGVFDAAGAMIAIARHVRVTKLAPAQGAAIELVTEVVFPVSETAQVTVAIPPAGQFSLARLMRNGWLTVISASQNAPPANPAIGDTYLVPWSGVNTGAWANLGGMIVQWDGIAWVAIQPPNGFVVSRADVGSANQGRFIQLENGGWNHLVASSLGFGLSRLATAADVTALAADRVLTPAVAVTGFPPNARAINPGWGLSGGGSLAADRTLSVHAATLDARYSPAGPVAAWMLFDMAASTWGGQQVALGTPFGGTWNPATNVFTFTTPRVNTSYTIEGGMTVARHVYAGGSGEWIEVGEPILPDDIGSKSTTGFQLRAPSVATPSPTLIRVVKRYTYLTIRGS